MRGPFHDFLLLPEAEEGERLYQNFWLPPIRASAPPHTYRAFLHRNHGIQVPDDLYGYIMDSLGWVPTELPFEELRERACPWSGYGMNHYGHTAIRKRGAPVFRRVCEAWIQLFSEAPRTFTLRG